MAGADDGSLQEDLRPNVEWLGLQRVGSCSSLFYNHWLNRMKSRNDLVIIIIIIIIMKLFNEKLQTQLNTNQYTYK